VVVNRPGHDCSRSSGAGPATGWDTTTVEIPSLEVSSTELRRLVAAGRSIRHLTPDPVIRLVANWGLYRDRSARVSNEVGGSPERR
jgi:nicotinic acid mononucleotide adenylyltransferase